MNEQPADPVVSSARVLPRAAVEPAALPTASGLMGLAVGVVVVAALYLGKEVLIPITVAVLLSFVLAPFVSLLRRLHLPRLPSVFVAVLSALLIVVAMGGLIGSQLADLADDIPRYQTTIQQKIDVVKGYTIGRLSTVMKRIGSQVERASAPEPAANPAPPVSAGGTAGAPEAPPAEPKPIPVEVHQPTATPAQVAQSLLAPIIGPLETTGIIFIVAIFILLQQDDLRDRMIRLFGTSDLHRTTVAMDDAARRLSRYFLAQLALNAAFGGIIGTGLWIIGVPSPLLWGIIAAIMRFVPYIGAALSAIIPLALAAAVDPGWSMLLWTAALFVTIEPIIGHGVEPMVYGHSTGLSPISVIVSAIFWGWLWGRSASSSRRQ